MKPPGGRALMLFALCVAILTLVTHARGAGIDYFFVTFEENDGWRAGEWTRSDHALRLAKGEARIVATDEPDLQQALELGPSTPLAAVTLDAARLARAQTVHCEVWARPGATEEAAGEEFFDFAGAVLGFFRVGGEGEVRALHGRKSQEALWISTGVRVPLDAAGLAADWLRFHVRLSPASGRWDLSIDGEGVLGGLQRVELPRNELLPLYLFGHASIACRFDNLLISAIEPDKLEKLVAARAARAARRGAARLRSDPTVRGPKLSATLRQPMLAEPSAVDDAPRLKGWQVTMQVGDREYRGPADRLDEPSDTPKIIAFAPTNDEAGNPLPQRIKITADAELRPGLNLRKLRWAHLELLGIEKYGVTISEGDFRTGLVQEVAVPPEWSRKATAVLLRVEK